MRRFLLISVVAAFAVVLWSGAARAASDEWPAFPITGNSWRGPGFYLSWLKIIAVWLLFLLWVKTTDWVNVDCMEMKAMDHMRWIPIIFGAFAGVLVLSWLIPYFWVGFVMLLIAYAAPLATFIIIRNSKVTNDQRVLTPDHIRYMSAYYLNKLGANISYEKPDPHE